jgi:hypothetical protein
MKTRLVNLKKLIDPWSVPHFLFGVMAALAVVTFTWPIFTSFFAVLVVAILWEILEKYFRLSEAPGNAWVDVLLPLIAFTITLPLVLSPSITREQCAALLIVSVFLYLTTNYLSWRARLERDRDFQC